MQIISRAVGIDLGTTNSAVAVLTPTEEQIVIHRDEAARRETTPSSVWKDAKTGEIMVGMLAYRRAGHRPEPIRSIKRKMGEQTPVRLTDVDVTPEQVSAYILGEMKRQIALDLAGWNTVESTWIVDRAMVTVPAYFDQRRIDATRQAAELAGLEVLELLHEPTAAAYYYCWRHNVRNGNFLVYDLGGGTFDATVLRCTAGAFEPVGISGHPFLGGDDIDTLIAEHLLKRLQKEEEYALDLDVANDDDDRLRFTQLKLLAEGVKKGLSTATEFVLHDQAMKDKRGEPVVIDTTIERAEIEPLIEPLIERSLEYCCQALEQASQKTNGEVRLETIDQVILVGGSTHIPLVRERVRQAFCAAADAAGSRARCGAGPRARCAEPTYDKVDTIVALGAAICAAAAGGLAVYNEARTVRVAFRDAGATAGQRATVGGEVKALDSTIDLRGGRVRLTLPDQGFSEEQELSESGTFGFRNVPLQSSADNALSFEVLDRFGTTVAVAGRAIRQDAGARTPTPPPPPRLPKAISLEVMRDSRPMVTELLPALTPLPAHRSFPFVHPGDTELIRLPVYQDRHMVREILVPVASSLPRGAPIDIDLNVDELSFITIRGSVDGKPFAAEIQPAPDRALPSEAEVVTLEKRFKDALRYLQEGRRSVIQARFDQALDAFRDAVRRDEVAQAVNEFEEMERLTMEGEAANPQLQPPKDVFDALVKDCLELNTYVANLARERGHPFDPMENARAIDAQRQQGERAHAARDQIAYGDAYEMLENNRQYLIAVYRKLNPQPTVSPEQEAANLVDAVAQEATEVGHRAAATARNDLRAEVEQIQRQMEGLRHEAARNPQAVVERVRQIRPRLAQIAGQLKGTDDSSGPDGERPGDPQQPGSRGKRVIDARG